MQPDPSRKQAEDTVDNFVRENPGKVNLAIALWVALPYFAVTYLARMLGADRTVVLGLVPLCVSLEVLDTVVGLSQGMAIPPRWMMTCCYLFMTVTLLLGIDAYPSGWHNFLAVLAGLLFLRMWYVSVTMKLRRRRVRLAMESGDAYRIAQVAKDVEILQKMKAFATLIGWKFSARKPSPRE